MSISPYKCETMEEAVHNNLAIEDPEEMIQRNHDREIKRYMKALVGRYMEKTSI